MNERSVQNALFDYLRSRGYLLACPNYTPADWWECDLLGITRAGLAVEFEIKLTRSDFKADAGKSRVKYDLRKGGFAKLPAESKHDLLASRDPRAPSRFFYVVPAGLLMPGDVPEWAGMIEIAEKRTHRTVRPRLTVREIRPAPRLHRQKPDERVVCHMSSVFYWRFWNLRRGLEEAEVPA